MGMEMRDSILIVEDSPTTRQVLRDIFEDAYNILEAENGAQAMVMLRQNSRHILVVLLDVTMPIKDGHEVLEEMKADEELQDIPVVMVTSHGGVERHLQALRMGAMDLFAKPFEPEIIRRRVQYIAELYRYKWYLESQVVEQGDVLRQSNEMMVDALSTIIEHRSLESGSHIQRIRGFTRILLDQLASTYPEYSLDPQTIDTIVSASTLHDIGKISVPDSVLNKPGRLTPEEFETIKQHTTAGADMLEALQGVGSREYLYFAYNICRHHHERWDGKGYPDGLEGDEIPLCAQVVGVADVYDALTTERVYKPAYPHHQAINMILNRECGVFSPRLMECLMSVADQFEKLARLYMDNPSLRCDHTGAPQMETSPQPSQEVTLQQLSQIKYQAMLRYTDATVVEVDADRKLYHVVYSPDPHLIPPLPSPSLSEFLLAMVGDRVHPDDYPLIQDVNSHGLQRFFAQKLRRLSFRYRLFHQGIGDYRPYDVTFLYLDTGGPPQKKFLAIWRRVNDDPAPSPAVARKIPHDVMRRMVGDLIRLRYDSGLTIQEGVSNLCALTGFTRQEISSNFHDRFMELVAPKDREKLRQTLTGQLSRGSAAVTECRLLHKNGAPVWVSQQFRLSAVTGQTESLYATMADVSSLRADQERSAMLLERSQTILNQSHDVIFEWNFAQNHLICSSQWEETFGYPLTPESDGKLLPQSDYIHPDDLRLLRQRFAQATEESAAVEQEVRILTHDGRYLWCRLRATLLWDGDGLPQRAVGAITNVDEIKRSILSLQAKAEQDPLTQLLNKSSAQSAVEHSIQIRSSTHYPSAMLVVDLDQFSRINERFGHLFGDTLLTHVAMEIKRLFRENDVVSRIGGDEFLIFMTDIPSLTLVEERCARLNEAVRGLYHRQLIDHPVTCSIGVSLYPAHGSDYHSLFRRADRALFRAKALGRNGYIIYDEVAFSQLPDSKPEDRDPGSPNSLHITGGRIASAMFRQLYQSTNLDETIESMLATIGRQLNVARVCVYENGGSSDDWSNPFEWCNDGVDSKRDRQEYLYALFHHPGWEAHYNRQGVFYCPDVSQLPKELRELIAPYHVYTILTFAIREDGELRGYINFDETRALTPWSQDQVELLTYLSEVLSVFLLKRQAKKRNRPSRATEGTVKG